jgi:DNA-binding GntR family transcriptional regulator
LQYSLYSPSKDRINLADRLSQLIQVPLHEQVCTAIRNAIIEGKFRPGEIIPQEELAAELGISRTPVREAIRLLEQQGLVVVRPKNGTYIAKLNREEERDGLRTRAVLEELAVEQALERLTPDDWVLLCERFQRLLDKMQDAAARTDPIAVVELDIEWHTLLVEASGNASLARASQSLGMPILTWSFERELYPLSNEQLSDVAARHAEVLSALRGRDAEECRKAVRFHILRKLSDIDTAHARGSSPA